MAVSVGIIEKKLRVGIAGVGTVGQAVYAILIEQAAKLAQKSGYQIEVTAISARSFEKAKNNGINFDAVEWFSNPVELATSNNIDVFIELIGGADGAAYDAVLAALKMGRPVITANKALLAHHGADIAQLAEQKNTPFNYEAAIAGGIPIVKVLRDSLVGNDITRIYGILNGTCNYILTEMEEHKLSFDKALQNAQNLGYAEADPSFDIDGQDTAHKLILLTAMAFDTVPEDRISHLEGIRTISQEDIQAAKDLGYRIKLLGMATKTDSGIEQSVQPVMFPISSSIAEVSSVTNAVMVETQQLGELLLSGPGAGGAATASAVVGDIVDITKKMTDNSYCSTFGLPIEKAGSFNSASEQIREGGYFIRLNVLDRAGVFAAVADIMANNGISLKSIVQKETTNAEIKGQDLTEAKTIILITHATTDSAIAKAFEQLEQADYLMQLPQKIRIERKF